jgi:thioredoxin-like negative regulator of GroEL
MPEVLYVIEFSAKDKVTRTGTPSASARMDVIFDEIAQGYADLEKVRFMRVEIMLSAELADTLNPETSKRFAINHGPTTVFLKEGQEVREQLVGGQTEQRLKQLIDELK